MSFNHCSSTFELFIFATNITAGAVLMLTCNHQQVENLLDWPLGPSDAKLGTTVFFSSIWQLGTILEFNCALAFLGLRTERSTRRACCSAKVAYQGLAPASLAVCAHNTLLLSVCFPHASATAPLKTHFILLYDRVVHTLLCTLFMLILFLCGCCRFL